MKTLLLVRHAKSDWSDGTLSDFDRPLNERGKRDAPVMAQRLLDKKVVIDLFVSSPAKRAKKTAITFAEAYGKKKEDVLFIDELYAASTDTFETVIKKLDDQFSSAAIFSHNPDITYFANSLADARIDNMPTCSIFAVTADCDRWADFENAEKTFLFFDYPKNEQ